MNTLTIKNERNMAEPLSTTAISTNTISAIGVHVASIGTWIAACAGWLSPVLGCLAGAILVGYYIWQWVSKFKEKTLTIKNLKLDTKIKEAELAKLTKVKIHPLHK